VMVSATANEVGAPSDTCADGTADGAFPTCKPTSDVHQPSGVGATDQLAYYSNYGPRIDIAAPGGARQFNLPGADRGGAPASADGTTTYGVVSIVSDTALGPDAACLQIDGLTPGRCYNVLQGTSFASPLVAGVAALAIAAAPALRDHPRAIVDVLQHGARDVVNATPKLSASDTSPGDSGGPGCATGYCHLGGKPIRSEEAYGAGVVDATGALQRLGVS
jgi:subtilisin family serine protease